MKELQSVIETATRKNETTRDMLANKRQEQDSYRNKQDALALLQKRIEAKERQIKAIQESLDSFSDDKRKVAQELLENQSRQMKILDELSQRISQCLDTTTANALTTSKIKVVKNTRSSYENEYQSTNEDVKRIKNETQFLADNLRTTRAEAKKARDYAQEISGFDFGENDEAPEAVEEKFNELPGTILELDNCINVLKLRCEGIAIVDESILEDYKKYQREIAEKQNECTELEKELTEKENEIEQLKPLWLNALQTLIDKINQNFSQFMQHLHYSGEVYLFTSAKEYAFDDYGIKIKVKFRDSEPMKDLDAYHQSGGERSVSTMIYMLSLQELAHVPFRVVDEINQGMDEKNERCVFDLISEVSRRNSSQYFLLSPKLLTNLNYTPEMTVHIIFNGPKVYVDWAKVLPKLTQKKETANTA